MWKCTWFHKYLCSLSPSLPQWIQQQEMPKLILSFILFHIILVWRSVCPSLLWRCSPCKKRVVQVVYNINLFFELWRQLTKIPVTPIRRKSGKKKKKILQISEPAQNTVSMYCRQPDPTSLAFPSCQHMHLMLSYSMPWMPFRASSGSAVAGGQEAELVLRVVLGTLKRQPGFQTGSVLLSGYSFPFFCRFGLSKIIVLMRVCYDFLHTASHNFQYGNSEYTVDSLLK